MANLRQYEIDRVHETYNSLSQQNSGYFECQLPVLNETEKAICFDADNSHLTNQHRGVWVPKSQMEILDMIEAGSGTRYFIKNWLYSKFK